MLLPMTETLPDGVPIDARPTPDAATLFIDGQLAAIDVVRSAIDDISSGANAMAAAIRGGRAIHYAAAGSSGLMALADASELHGTFGIPADAVKIHMAGGVPVNARMPGDTEDDGTAGQIAGAEMSSGDVALVLSASGTTPFALEVARAAKAKGAIIIGLANNADTPLLNMADISICLATPPEVIAGSTRLGAGTAQKVALNLMSTLMGIALGHVWKGMMINVVADNAKLATRAAGIVSKVANVSTSQAQVAIAQAGGDTKVAILIARGHAPQDARRLIDHHEGHLGPAMIN